MLSNTTDQSAQPNRRSPPLSAYVRRKTRGEHRSLVGRLHITARGVTRPRYAKLLTRMLGVLVPLEEKFESFPELALLVPDLAERRKAHLVINDLERLGGDVEAPLCAWLPPLTDVPRALGAMFAIEALMHGAPALARDIRAVIGDDTPADFLCCYGEAGDERWKAFRSFVDEVIVDPESKRQFLQSARATFHALETWFEQESELFAET